MRRRQAGQNIETAARPISAPRRETPSSSPLDNSDRRPDLLTGSQHLSFLRISLIRHLSHLLARSSSFKQFPRLRLSPSKLGLVSRAIPTRPSLSPSLALTPLERPYNLTSLTCRMSSSAVLLSTGRESSTGPLGGSLSPPPTVGGPADTEL